MDNLHIKELNQDNLDRRSKIMVIFDKLRKAKKTHDKQMIEKCARICECPVFKMAPSCINIDPESHEPIDRNISQRDMVSFFNDCLKIRADEIRSLGDKND